jgi:hypothetical protein
MTTGKLLLLLVWHLILTGLPGVAAALYAARRGTRSVPVLLAIGLAVSGGVGILGFWSYYGGRVWGEAFSYFVLLGSALLSGWSLFSRPRLDRDLLRQLAVPLAVWALGSAFLVMLGFLHGGTDQPLATAVTRFSHQLPGDNGIPLAFAEWVYAHGHHGPIPVQPGIWHFSDRPPLQTGYVLSQRPFGWDAEGLNYQVIGVLLQELWIVGLWALLEAAAVRRITRALAVLTVQVSGLAIVNGFFVWPKLQPAAFLLAAAALVITPLWPEVRRSAWGAALLAGLLALAMLSHGASAFGIVPLAVVACVRGLPSLRWVAVAAAAGVVLLAPWSAFQRWADPPGNRLVKWTLAGSPAVDDRGTLHTIADAYAEAGIGGAIHDKVENLATISGGTMAPKSLQAAVESGSLEQAVRAIRIDAFFYTLPSFGLLLLSPIAMLVAAARGSPRIDAEWSFGLSCLALFVVGCLFWALLAFGNGESRTVVHVGSYLLPILAMAGAVAGLRSVYPRFALWYLIGAAVLSLAVYAPDFEPPPDSSYSPLTAIVAAAALAAFAIVAARGGRRFAHDR